MSWSPTPNAIGYEVEQFFGDPSCCASLFSGITNHETEQTEIEVQGQCYSWRVRSICADGEVSPWSEKVCNDGESCFVPEDEEEVCQAPTDLDCGRLDGESQDLNLTWDYSGNPINYQIEFTNGDSDCCDGPPSPPRITEAGEDNQFTVANGVLGCFSWRVRSQCADGEYSEWSAKMCQNQGECYYPEESIEEETTGRSALQEGALNDIKVFPNPFTDFVEVTVPSFEMEVAISIMDINGRVVFDSKLSNVESNRIATDHLVQGTYLLVIKSGEEVNVEKLVKY